LSTEHWRFQQIGIDAAVDDVRVRHSRGELEFGFEQTHNAENSGRWDNEQSQEDEEEDSIKDLGDPGPLRLNSSPRAEVACCLQLGIPPVINIRSPIAFRRTFRTGDGLGCGNEVIPAVTCDHIESCRCVVVLAEPAHPPHGGGGGGAVPYSSTVGI